MEYIYCAMLLHAVGKPITEESVANVLKAAGVEPDAARVKALTAALEGVDIKSVIESAAVQPVAKIAEAAEAPAPKEEKKEEKKEEEKKVSEEEAAAGLSALFG